MSESLAHPLDWPSDVPRRKASDAGLPHHFAPTTVDREVREVQRQLRMLGADRGSVVISTNLALRLDGLPRSSQRAPEDPAAVVHWRQDAEPFALPCDKWPRVEHNLHAIALHLAALRGLDRWGCGTSSQAFAGYRRLPPPPTADGEAAEALAWWDYFGVDRDLATREEILADFRDSAKTMHPDVGGARSAFQELVAMKEAALAALTP